MSSRSHGFIGSHLQPFTELLPSRRSTFNPADLAALAVLIKGPPDTPKDGADPEENLWVPAGYTYFGQFVDHDLTFDSTSSLNPADRPPQGSHVPTNLRTPRFDLDCVYGDGPEAQPFMYAADGATLLTQGNDLARAANDRAIIGDKRNDENSIVCQIQLGMIRYHNKIVALLRAEPEAGWNTPGELFTSARNEVRWTYQRILVEDFLPRIIAAPVLANLVGQTPHGRRHAYALYTADKRANLPREFVGAAYRFGHSGVRTGYRLNADPKALLTIFAGSEPPTPADTLLGFDPLPPGHVIDSWARFFPDTAPGADTGLTGRVAADGPLDPPGMLLQYAYKIDTSMVDPLAVLPANVPEPEAAGQAAAAIGGPLPNAPLVSLALLNLLRGNAYALPTGQRVAAALRAAGLPAAEVGAGSMVVRAETDLVPAGGNPDGAQAFQWGPIPEALRRHTPLWFYVLAEAQAPLHAAVPGDAAGVFLETALLNGPGALTQLGWVGGRIVGEVFYGLLDQDPDSVFNHAGAAGFTPRMAGNGRVCMRNLLDF